MPRKRRSSRNGRRSPHADPLARERALEALNNMRSKEFSLTRAAREARTTPATVRKYVGGALRQTEGGRYATTPSDRLTRRLWFHTPDGKVEVAVRGSRPAERVARYMSAVDCYLTTGDSHALAEFENQRIRSGRRTYVFLTDTAALERLADAGETAFERLYVLRA